MKVSNSKMVIKSLDIVGRVGRDDSKSRFLNRRITTRVTYKRFVKFTLYRSRLGS